ncbi:MAG TPA: fumarylacetoacetate hydrolase family protein [Puia sp.]|nr:fumarylacetoacetate hydrolase family protein [Puia sp.]
MRLYRTKKGNLLADQEKFWLFDKAWDELINRNDLHGYLARAALREDEVTAMEAADLLEQELLAPIGSQEVWAAGVTYLRSRDARMEESKDSGAASFYDKVYEAERPELFFKSLPHRVAAHGEKVYIRRDSSWNVPEPELTLFINTQGHIQGYTIGNDMSSRSIEGENPLYLPQAKVYDRSAALGPGLYVPAEPIGRDTVIRMSIRRGANLLYRGEVPISQIKRSLTDLAGWLYRESDFPAGCFLMTGTCLVPANDFTLKEGDNVEISIDGIGTLYNAVGYRPNCRNNIS